MDLSTISGRLAHLRKAEDLTVRDFAERVGVSHGSVSNYEPGGRSDKIPGDYLAEVCGAFNVDPRWILLGEEPMKRTDPGQAAKDLAEIRRILREGS